MAPAVSEKRRLLITGARAPVALHLDRLLTAAGHQVWLADCVTHPLSAAGLAKNRYLQIPPFTEAPDQAGTALRTLIDETGIDTVIPTCEEALHLGAIWQRSPPDAHLFAPDFELLQQVHNKHAFIGLCQRIGLPTPISHLLEHRDDLTRFDPCDDWVFKPVWSRFGTDVLIRPRAAMLQHVTPTPDAPWIAQQALTGTEICAYAVARNGRLTALASYTGLVRAGPGAAVCFQPIHCDRVRHFVETFVKATSWTGQVSFDLIRCDTGDLFPIECNPRATSGLHFFSDPAGFSQALFGAGQEVHPDVHSPQGVRMALWLYGLPKLFGQNRKPILRALREVEDVINRPDDPIGWFAQARSVAEFARIALRERVSLQCASTWGIEWNGTPPI